LYLNVYLEVLAVMEFTRFLAYFRLFPGSSVFGTQVWLKLSRRLPS